MNEFMQFLAAHDVAVGLMGTLVVILAVIVGFGRRHAVMASRLDVKGGSHRRQVD